MKRKSNIAKSMYLRSWRKLTVLRDMDLMIMGQRFKNLPQDMHLVLQELDELAGVPKILVGDPLVGVGAGSNLVQIRADSPNLLNHAGEALLERFREHGALLAVGNGSVSHEWSKPGTESLSGAAENGELMGVKVTSHPMGVGAVQGHWEGG